MPPYPNPTSPPPAKSPSIVALFVGGPLHGHTRATTGPPQITHRNLERLHDRTNPWPHEVIYQRMLFRDLDGRSIVLYVTDRFQALDGLYRSTTGEDAATLRSLLDVEGVLSAYAPDQIHALPTAGKEVVSMSDMMPTNLVVEIDNQTGKGEIRGYLPDGSLVSYPYTPEEFSAAGLQLGAFMELQSSRLYRVRAPVNVNDAEAEVAA